MEVNKPKRKMSRNSLRNMRQYKDMTNEEFNKLYSQVVFGYEKDELIEARFNRLMQEFNDEYDLSELLPNDRAVLKTLINALLQLDDYEIQLRELSSDINSLANNIVIIDRLSGVCDKLRDSISKMQNDLGITRKIRKSDKDRSVMSFLDELKKKAEQFSREKYRYVVCEKCGTILATVWYLRQESPKNKITVHCEVPDNVGEPCGWTKTFTAKELTDLGGSNQPDKLPESIR